MGEPLKRQKEGKDYDYNTAWDRLVNDPMFLHLFNNEGEGCLSDDSDDEYPSKEIKRQFEIYDKQGEGFDIDVVPYMWPLAGIGLLDMTHCEYAKHYGQDVERCAKDAMWPTGAFALCGSFKSFCPFYRWINGLRALLSWISANGCVVVLLFFSHFLTPRKYNFSVCTPDICCALLVADMWTKPVFCTMLEGCED